MIAQLDSNYFKTRPTKIFTRLFSYFLVEGRPVTAPGRFINPITFLFLKVYATAFGIRKKELSPIFILGTGRSGTTLLGKILSIHKDVAYLNEPKAIWHEVFKNEDLIGNFTSKAGKYRLDPNSITPIQRRRLNGIYSAILAVTRNSRVVDKYPELIFRYDFVKKIFPNAKFVVISRNGIDTAGSIASWSKRNQISKVNLTENWWGKNHRKWEYLVDQIVKHDRDLKPIHNEISNMKDDVNRGAVEWIVTMNEALQLLEKNKEILLVTYESLIKTPEYVMKNIYSFCELNDDLKSVEYAKLQINSNEKKYELTTLSPLLRKIIDRISVEIEAKLN
ncbi:sulfotransferase [Ekhidna sp.]|uniref:sulfotransferase family protein n=1 Tax=Ekhidna sp. TaxID=2608089 RepID=UPI0032F053F0